MLGLAAALAVALALTLAGCGGDAAPRGDRIAGRRLTIYTSLPFLGPSAASAEATLAGERMALAAHAGRVGRYRIALAPLDDATVSGGGWDPGQTNANARLAVRDPTTIGYLGDLNSGASAVSIPLLSRAGIPQISPTSTAVGLTSGGPEAEPGEPQKYYPTMRRTFARVVPSDRVQAAVQVALQRAAGCRRTYVLQDPEVDGTSEANSFAVAAQAARLPVTGPVQYDPRSASFGPVATAAAQSGADCVMISALDQDGAAALTEQVARAMPDARLFAGNELAQRAFYDPAAGGVPASLDGRLTMTVATLSIGDYPPAGRRFFHAYARRYGAWQPDAIFGYEAMSLMLDAISRATRDGRGAARRSRVIHRIFATRDRRSVLGTYSIDSDGDTTLHAYGVYHVRDGRLVFAGAIG